MSDPRALPGVKVGGGSTVGRLEGPQIHLVIPTHTTRHLAACLSGVALQSRPPDSVTLTCDVDDPAIAAEVDAVWPRVAAVLRAHARPVPIMRHVARPHSGVARLNEVRNNALRALDAASALRDEDLVVVLDGDTVLAPDAIWRHERLARVGAGLVVPYRVNLGQEATGRVSAEGILAAAMASDAFSAFAELMPIDDAERASLKSRARRYRRQMWLRWLAPWLTKAHKPKVLGGHHAASVRVLREVNGYDERFTGYGYDDDDLSRRVHALRPRVRTEIAMEIHAVHLWHPTRAPARPAAAPGYATFVEPWTPRCVSGWACEQGAPGLAIRMVRDN